MIARYIARQFSLPTGLLGRMIGRGMARHNEREARWTVDLLAIEPDSRVLEIGFGPDVAIQYAAERATRGHVSGVDSSEAMLKLDRQRNATGVANGSMHLTTGDVRSLPFADDSFDRAFSIHCIYFWGEPLACLRQIRRVLRPGGVVAITIHLYISGTVASRPPTCSTSTGATKLRSCSPIPASARHALSLTRKATSRVSAFLR